jgi:site-specific DNA-methyltransferase (adenine-specific)
MKEADSNSIDFMMTDPPYGVGYVSNYYVGDDPRGPIENDSNIDTEFHEKWIAEASRMLKPHSAVMIFTRWDVWQDWVDMISPYWSIKNMIVWVKNNWSAGDLTGNVGGQHELIIFAARGNFKINGKRLTNVWEANRVPPTRHPTEKPVELIEMGVKLCTKKGDVVLDPFLGSGTTLAACQRAGRSCVGFEIEPGYEKYYADRAMSHTPTLDSYF